MKVGVFGTFMSPICTPDVVRDVGQRVEAAGLDSLWMGEHVVLFDEMEFPYPASKDGRIPVPEGGGLLDTVATFGFLANATSTLRLGTGITLISQRHPLYTAKEFATLDWLSNGRVDFGVGVGWCKEEVIASGFGWEDRGPRSDEFLDLIKRLWTEELVAYEGRFFNLPQACRLDPKPVQAEFPVLVGGHSKPAFRRAATYGTGWYGFALTPEQTARLLGQLDEALARAGRSRDGFEIIITPARESDADFEAFAQLGVDRLVLHMGSQAPARLEARLNDLAQVVRKVA
jgi:probable F420-dependent oxidoreductase